MPQKISIIPLGGCREIGNNMIVIESKKDIIILDSGVLFPEDDDFGYELIIPDISYLVERKKKIRGIIFSHGHEDHIGAVPFLLERINPPLFGTDLTMGLIKSKLEDAGLIDRARLKTVNHRSKLILGDFELDFCHVNHSIPGAVATRIKTPVGYIVYTGDYKFDQTPVNTGQTDYQKLSDWGKEGIRVLLGDSTNAEREGHSLSERVVAQNIEEGFKLINGRIIVATFSTNIHRIQHIISAARKTGRKVAVAGRSMFNTIQVAADLGYLDIPPGLLITLDEANKMEPGNIVLLMTGSQGEYGAALTRLSRGDHRDMEIKPGDTVFMSASPIPGNEKAIGNTINRLYSLGAEVIYNGMLDIHASGHACQEEIKLMINLTGPDYLVPVHGEFRHLFHHAQLARQAGVPVQNILIPDNGQKIDVFPKRVKMGNKIEVNKTLIEGYRVCDNGKEILGERKKMARQGYINILMFVNKNGELKNKPVIISRGFTSNRDSRELLKKVKEKVQKLIEEFQNNRHGDPADLKSRVNYEVNNLIYDKLKRAPLITPFIIQVNQDRR
ncbi:ribonuclease J [Halothermothrix orenii]|uniref:Ribonuclease J n=1 Tax=Halothermothrix orenii (strain H 168 / OCM 544 / DSM 9562) TaxID=373903 RepID=B8CYD2_HALOH|nr:ribonuclease J [Halothermothrix orenii]ACL70301.1 beta-lactamase domain protein [Halothermothrix orenii H 168]